MAPHSLTTVTQHCELYLWDMLIGGMTILTKLRQRIQTSLPWSATLSPTAWSLLTGLLWMFLGLYLGFLLGFLGI